MINDKTSSNQNHAKADAEPPSAVVVPKPDTAKNHSNSKEIKKWEILLLAGTLIAAGFAARYTHDQSITADDQEKRSLRAYLGPSDIDLETQSLTDPKYKPMPRQPAIGDIFKDFVVVTVKNYGQTPSNETEVWAAWVALDFPQGLQGNFDFSRPSDTGPHPEITKRSVFPQQTYKSRIAIRDLEPFRLANILKKNVYIYGQIIYQDIFNGSWTTDFCYIYSPKLAQGERLIGCPWNNKQR